MAYERIILIETAGDRERSDHPGSPGNPVVDWPLVGVLLVEVRDTGSKWWAAPSLTVFDDGILEDELLEVAARSMLEDLLPEVDVVARRSLLDRLRSFVAPS